MTLPALPSRSEISKQLDAIADQFRPCGRDKARELCLILTGCYPNLNVADPDVYVRGLVSLLQEYPADAATQAIDEMTKALKFAPTRADLASYLDRAMRVRKSRRETLLTKLARIDQIEKEKAERERLDRDRQEFRKKHGDKSPLDVLKERGMFKVGEFPTERDEMRKSVIKNKISFVLAANLGDMNALTANAELMTKIKDQITAAGGVIVNAESVAGSHDFGDPDEAGVTSGQASGDGVSGE